MTSTLLWPPVTLSSLLLPLLLKSEQTSASPARTCWAHHTICHLCHNQREHITKLSSWLDLRIHPLMWLRPHAYPGQIQIPHKISHTMKWSHSPASSSQTDGIKLSFMIHFYPSGGTNNKHAWFNGHWYEILWASFRKFVTFTFWT